VDYDRVFFFQAEDGIRGLIVTGVQTCALPISDPARAGGRRVPGRPESSAPLPEQGRSAERTPPVCCDSVIGPTARRTHPPRQSRSEERRVGEEGRARVAPSHGTNENGASI